MPETLPASVTVATAGASDFQPDVIACVWPFDRLAEAVACVVAPIFTGLATVTAIELVVGVGAVAVAEVSLPHAAVSSVHTIPNIAVLIQSSACDSTSSRNREATFASSPRNAET